MSNKRYLIIIYLNELHLWLKSGAKKLQKNKMISANLTKKGVFSSLDKVGEKVIKDLPDFDDDFEILIVEVPAEKLSKLKKNSNAFTLPFEWISRIFPITSRGKKLLNGKLDDRIITQEPIFEKQFLLVYKEKEKDLSQRGAEALLKTFGYQKYLNQFIQKLDLVNNALLLRENNSDKISAEKPFLTNLVLYDRNKPFPNNDLGYFYDVGTLLKIYENNDDDKRKFLRKFADTLERFKLSSEYRKIDTMIMELHNSSMIGTLEKIIKENHLVTAILFLYLRSNIRETNDPEKSGLIEIYNNEFLVLNYEEEVALAFWLIGYFFGFEMVSSLYYKRFNSRVLNFDSPFPEIKKNIIAIKDALENEIPPKTSIEDNIEKDQTPTLKENEKIKSTSDEKQIKEDEDIAQNNEVVISVVNNKGSEDKAKPDNNEELNLGLPDQTD